MKIPLRRGFVLSVLALPFAVAAGEAERRAFERFCDLALVPPEIRTGELPAYSTNRLAFAMCNGAAMTKGGRLYANWIAGEDGPGSFTVGNHSDDGGETWSDVDFAVDGHASRKTLVTDRCNIIGNYWTDPDGRLHFFTDQTMLHFDGRAGVWESVCDDPDAAKPVWSAPRRIAHGHVINKPIVRKNGEWVLPVYLNKTWNNAESFPRAFPELDAERGATCYVSTDKGRTWEKRGTAKVDQDWPESTYLELKDGTLRVFARVCGKGLHYLVASDSSDGGWTWSKPRNLDTMNNPAARFQVLRLASGRVLFVCHGAPTDDCGNRRRDLTAYLSEDEGETWKGGLLLDKGNGSYPDAFEAADGYIYVTHDHDRYGDAEIRMHRFNEDDVLAGRIVSPRGRLSMLVSRGMASKKNRKVQH